MVKPNDRLTSTERLDIYHRQYWYRILDSFNEDFPGLRAVLGRARLRAAGARVFDRLPVAIVHAAESRIAPGMRGLREHPEFAGKQLALALDMIRLEWAHIEAFDNAERKALGPEDLLELGPELALACSRISGCLRSAISQWTILRDQSEPRMRKSTAGPATLSARLRAVLCVRRYARLKPQQIFLAVHRVEFTVYLPRLEADEFRFAASDRPRPGRSAQALEAASGLGAAAGPSVVCELGATRLVVRRRA